MKTNLQYKGKTFNIDILELNETNKLVPLLIIKTLKYNYLQIVQENRPISIWFTVEENIIVKKPPAFRNK